ncbi:MAG: DNA polymerase III subunit alpha, partial [Gammaproteobacteria bacterium]|nr:DNA polymerase III subunit alpha [Gammaproteobacteria bacterium]
ANAIFDQMEKFAGYGFNKSHAAAYALLSYQTAYLKAHFPGEFMAAVLSADMDHTDKVVTLIRECAEIGLKVLPPDVNHSQYAFTAEGRTIRYGLGAVRGVGQGAAEALIGEREAHGAFANLEDLCRRLDLQKLNRRVLEALLRSGSCDALGPNRATLMERLPTAMQLGEQGSRASRAGQDDLFGLAAPEPSAPVAAHAAELPEWPQSVRLAGERETLGLYLTGHPIGAYESGLARLVSHRIGDLIGERPMPGAEPARGRGGRTVTVAGLIDEVRKRGPRTILTLDDSTGRIEASLFEEQFQQFKALISKDALVLAEGQLRFDEFSDGWRIGVRRLTDLAKVREQQARRIVLKWPESPATAALQSRLAELLERYRPGPCALVVEYAGAQARGMLALGEAWRVQPAAELIEALEQLFGGAAVRVLYSAPADAQPRSADGH